MEKKSCIAAYFHSGQVLREGSHGLPIYSDNRNHSTRHAIFCEMQHIYLFNSRKISSVQVQFFVVKKSQLRSYSEHVIAVLLLLPFRV